jgi:hypothetical protein
MISPRHHRRVDPMRHPLVFALVLAFLAHPARADDGCAPTREAARPVTLTGFLPDGSMATEGGERIRLASLDRRTLPIEHAMKADARFVQLGETDRHGALPGDIYIDGHSLRAELVRDGLARLRPSTLADPCLDRLRDLETAARVNRLGLWNDPRYAIISADDRNAVSAQAGRFVIAIGKVVHVGVRKNRVYLDFGDDWRRDAAAVMDQRMLGSDLAGDPTSLFGRVIEVRGVVRDGSPPHIEVEASGAFVVLDGDRVQ